MHFRPISILCKPLQNQKCKLEKMEGRAGRHVNTAAFEVQKTKHKI